MNTGMIKRLLPLFAMATLALGAAACTEAASTPTSTPTAGPAPTTTSPAGEGEAIITVLRHDALGDILVDNAGMTLYIFTQDEPGVSNCSGGCAATWPPVTTVGDPMQEITSAELGTIARDDGSTQVTVNGLPVYYYVGDTARGDANGQGLGDQWYVLGLDGRQVSGAVSPPPTPTTAAAPVTNAPIRNFVLPTISVEVGTTVRWTNGDADPHTVTHGTPPTPGTAFRSDSLNQGGSFSHTFDEPGRYDYFCEIHLDMTGSIVVTNGEEPTPEPTATTTPATPTATAAPAQTPDPSEPYNAVISGSSHQSFTVGAGTTVTWTNLDFTPHTVTAGTPGNPTDVFSSPVLPRDQTYSFTFDTPGVYDYFCEPHPFMTARVTVE